MKKLIFFLILAVALVGVVFAVEAAATHPPGVMNLEAAMSEIDAENCAIMSDSVSISVILMELPDTITFSGQPQGYMIKPIEIGQVAFADSAGPGYWLRL